MRFTSHRDFSRAFERAVFRARLPMAYSSGFNPHPRISYAGAAPTGSASEAEFLEIALAQVVVPDDVARELAEAMPAGLDVLQVVEAAPGSLADRLEASRWRIDLPVAVDRVTPAVEQFLAEEQVEVQRMTKKGLRTFDCRAAVVSLTIESADAGSRLALVLRHGTPSVRPDDVLTALAARADAEVGERALLTRLAQGPLAPDGTVGDPLS